MTEWHLRQDSTARIPCSGSAPFRSVAYGSGEREQCQPAARSRPWEGLRWKAEVHLTPSPRTSPQLLKFHLSLLCLCFADLLLLPEAGIEVNQLL